MTPSAGGARTSWPNHSHRRRSSSASTVRAAPSGRAVGRRRSAQPRHPVTPGVLDRAARLRAVRPPGRRAAAGQRGAGGALRGERRRGHRSAGEGRDRHRRGPADGHLVEASRSAAMICVGAVGLKHFDHNRIGSTAISLVSSARCPVAIVRGSERTPHEPGWVVVELDESPDSAAVLQCGVEEARLRGAPLRVLGSWQSRYTDVHDTQRWPTATAWCAPSSTGACPLEARLPRSRRPPGRDPRQCSELSGQAQPLDSAGGGGCPQRNRRGGIAGPDRVGVPSQRRLFGPGGRPAAFVVTIPS